MSQNRKPLTPSKIEIELTDAKASPVRVTNKVTLFARDVAPMTNDPREPWHPLDLTPVTDPNAAVKAIKEKISSLPKSKP